MVLPAVAAPMVLLLTVSRLITEIADACTAMALAQAFTLLFEMMRLFMVAPVPANVPTEVMAVGAVVLNRVRHSSFPNTIAGVVYQPGAFTAVDDGQINKAIQSSCYNAARDALNGWDPTGGAIYYYNPSTATSSWIRTRPIIKTIGKHVFCK